MSKYIDVDRLRAGINRNLSEAEFLEYNDDPTIAAHFRGQVLAYSTVLEGIDSLQQEQPIEGKQVIIITETDGDADIHWDCRSLDDARALLASAESYISDKQNEELRGQGSTPDYNTTEGRFRNAHKSQQEQPEVQNGKFVFPKYLYARTKDNKTIDMSYAPQDMTAVEYIRNDFVEQEQPEVDLEKEANECWDYVFSAIGWDENSLMTMNHKEFLAFARHFCELGLNARKEE